MKKTYRQLRADQVRKARTRAGDTIQEAAARVLISREAWRRYEAGLRHMSERLFSDYLLHTRQIKVDAWRSWAK